MLIICIWRWHGIGNQLYIKRHEPSKVKMKTPKGNANDAQTNEANERERHENTERRRKKNTNEVRKRPASEQCRAHLIKLTHFQLLHFLGCAMQFIIILQLYYCRCRFHKRCCCCCCCRCRSNLHCRRFSLFTRCFQLLFFSTIPKKKTISSPYLQHLRYLLTKCIERC